MSNRGIEKEIIEKCKTLNITYENHYIGLWDWYGKWKADLPTYQSRREYINSLFSPLLAIFEDTQRATDVEPIVQLDEWERLNRTIIKIKKDFLDTIAGFEPTQIFTLHAFSYPWDLGVFPS